MQKLLCLSIRFYLVSLYLCESRDRVKVKIFKFMISFNISTERPFVCIEEACGRSFAQVTNLNNHMKSHHKIQQYACNQCPRRFTQVTSLNQHLLLHTGFSGFYCPQCPDKTFKQQSQLHTHMKTHGLSFPYSCSLCEEKFLQMAHLSHHMKMHEEYKYR